MPSPSPRTPWSTPSGTACSGWLPNAEHVHCCKIGHEAAALEAYRAIFGERQSLLALAIREGSADFLASLISGGTVYADVHQFGRARERELWFRFQEEMHRREPGDWMFSRPAKNDWPMDLGYFMGYRIAEFFYMNATDKRQAIQDILAVTDYDAFLRLSGYGERFAR